MSKETNSDWQCFLCEGWNRNIYFTTKCNWCKYDKNNKKEKKNKTHSKY